MLHCGAGKLQHALTVQFGFPLLVHVIMEKLSLLVVPFGQPWGRRNGQLPFSTDRPERQDARTSSKRRVDENIAVVQPNNTDLCFHAYMYMCAWGPTVEFQWREELQ